MVIMALVTTFITAPLVHWLYPLKRVLEFETQVAGKQSLLFLIKDRAEVGPFTTLINLLARAQPKKWKLHGLHMVTLHERPSAYMATNHPDEVMKFAEDSARLMNLKLKPSSVVFDDTRESKKLHIVAAAGKNNAHFLFACWDVNGNEDSTQLGGVTLTDVSPLVSCNLAVMINRGLTHAVQHVAFIWGGDVNDLVALKLVRAMTRSKIIKLKVIIPDITDAPPREIGTGPAGIGQPQAPTAEDVPLQNLKSMGQGNVELCIVSAKKSKINKKVLEELSSGGEGQLLVIGTTRDWTQPHALTSVVPHDIAMGCAHSVLVVTKSIGAPKLPSQAETQVNLEPSSPLLTAKKKKKKRTSAGGKKKGVTSSKASNDSEDVMAPKEKIQVDSVRSD